MTNIFRQNRGWVWKELCAVCKGYTEQNEGKCYCTRWYRFKVWLVVTYDNVRFRLHG